MLVFFVSLSTANAQLIMSNYFNHTDSLTFNNWVPISGQGLQRPILQATNLAYPNFTSNNGGSVQLNNYPTSAEDLKKVLPTPQTTGTVYLSYLMRVASAALDTSTSASARQDHFCSFTGSSTTFGGRLYLRRDVVANKLRLGFGKAGIPTAFLTNDFEFNQTYCVVIKYQIIAGAGNDSTSLFVFNTTTGVPATEPATPLVISEMGSDLAMVEGVYLRQGSVVPGSVEIDGIIVANSWIKPFMTPNGTQDLKNPAHLSIKTVAPMPISNEANIQFESLVAGSTQINVTDLTGRNVSKQVVEAQIGVNTLTIDASKWTAGVYFMTVQNDNSVSKPMRIIKQ